MNEFVILLSHLPHRFLLQDKGYIDLFCDHYLKRKFNSKNWANICISLNDEYLSLAKKCYT